MFGTTAFRSFPIFIVLDVRGNRWYQNFKVLCYRSFNDWSIWS